MGEREEALVQNNNKAKLEQLNLSKTYPSKVDNYSQLVVCKG
jgi:hypothetical protein